MPLTIHGFFAILETHQALCLDENCSFRLPRQLVGHLIFDILSHLFALDICNQCRELITNDHESFNRITFDLVGMDCK